MLYTEWSENQFQDFGLFSMRFSLLVLILSMNFLRFPLQSGKPKFEYTFFLIRLFFTIIAVLIDISTKGWKVKLWLIDRAISNFKTEKVRNFPASWNHYVIFSRKKCLLHALQKQRVSRPLFWERHGCIRKRVRVWVISELPTYLCRLLCLLRSQ